MIHRAESVRRYLDVTQTVSRAGESAVQMRAAAAVSVVIPVHNAEPWLRDTLESVLNQTCDPGCLEVLVIDDGSTDQSAAIAEAILREGRLRCHMLRTPNQGPSAARNVGWRRATGEWIQFLDADDLLHPRKIECQLERASHLPTDVAVLYSDWQNLDLVGGRWEPERHVHSPRIGADGLADLLATENFLNLGCLLVRRSYLERVGGFDERYWLVEDVEAELRIAMAGGQYCRVETGQPVFFHRRHRGGSLGTRSARALTEACIRNASGMEAYWRRAGGMTSERARVLAGVYLGGARHYAGSDWTEFDRLVSRIERLVPGFVPDGPSKLRWLSKAVGYRRAERIAVMYRDVRRRLWRQVHDGLEESRGAAAPTMDRSA